MEYLNSSAVLIAVPCAIVLAAFIIAIGAHHNKRTLITELHDVDGLLGVLMTDAAHASPLARAVRAHVAQSPLSDKPVLRKPLVEIRREYADERISAAMSFWVGSLLTGVALLCTFVLIALVMTQDVSGAIRDTNESSARLSDAVRILGFKFFISAAGIFGSLLAVIVASRARAAIYAAADHPECRLVDAFTTVEAEQLNAKLRELELLRDAREMRLAHHDELRAAFVALDKRFENLKSIEVSVKTIGNDVSANLRNLMKDAMGEELKQILGETMVMVNQIAERVEATLTDAFARHIDSLRQTIAGQGQGQLEQILEKLQDTVSGGFHSESKKMAETLERFASVVPALEQQLSAFTGKVAEETRVRAEEGARTTQVLLERVAGLVETMTSQQTANAQAIERIQAVSAQGAEDIARRVETSGSEMVRNVLAASRVEIDAIVSQLQAASTANINRVGDLEARATSAYEIVGNASEALVATSRSIKELVTETYTVLAQVKTGGEMMRDASAWFANASSTLQSSVVTMNQVMEQSRKQTGEQQALLLEQRKYTKEVEQLWPTLFDAYLTKFKASSDDLGRSWADLHNKIAQMSNTLSGDFAENTQMLAEAVDQLVNLGSGKRAKT